MVNKFEEMPVEKNTKIIFQQEAKLGGLDILYQKWFWDGITAESIIFISDDVACLSNDEI